MRPAARHAATTGADGAPACLGVVIPCYNEAGTVDEVIRRVLAQPVVRRIVVVDDGSVDDSWAQLSTWPGRDPRVEVLRRSANGGKGAAVRDGLARLDTPVVVIQDADLEYTPEDLPRLLEPILRGTADVVYGTRFAGGAAAAGPWWHQPANRLFTWFCNLVTGLRLSDEAVGYKMFRVAPLADIRLRENGFGFCPEFTATVARLGLRVAEVPVAYRRRTRAQGKKFKRRHGLEAVACILRYGLGRGRRRR
ncbi:MAG: glycosyltransferase family 2 protein [Krumholzibacteria bacterium]|nr:glycosyltransferase family 2 protein [Candidatus Krumholzibacteria bacterium]